MERNKERIDRRVVRTKAAIRSAFLRLLGQGVPARITVTDVAHTAKVDRKTVYNYYEGVDAIREELEDELVVLVGNSIEGADFAACAREPLGLLQKVHAALTEQGELSRLLIGAGTFSGVLQKLSDAVSFRVGQELGDRLAPAEKNYAKMYADFLTSGILSVYRDWIGAGMQQPLEDVANRIRRFLSSGIAAFTKAEV